MHELIILPGWGQSSVYWQNQISLLKEFSPTVIDLPGFGSEKIVSADWGVPEYANWVAQKLAGKTNYVLLGHSFGGRVAAYLAAQQKIHASALVLYASPLLRTGELEIRNKKLKISSLFKLLPYSIRKIFYPADLRQAEEWGMGEVFRKAVVFDQRELLPKIKLPTLILWGDQDSEVPAAQAEEISKLITGSELKIFPGASHNLHLESPYLFYSAVNDFVKNLA